MAKGNWNPETVRPQMRCRLCRGAVKMADLVRLDGVNPAHRTCANVRGRFYTDGPTIIKTDATNAR